jgi:hypothetical protein
MRLRRWAGEEAVPARIKSGAERRTPRRSARYPRDSGGLAYAP